MSANCWRKSSRLRVARIRMETHSVWTRHSGFASW